MQFTRVAKSTESVWVSSSNRMSNPVLIKLTKLLYRGAASATEALPFAGPLRDGL
jgi:hypothetical protein